MEKRAGSEEQLPPVRSPRSLLREDIPGNFCHQKWWYCQPKWWQGILKQYSCFNLVWCWPSYRFSKTSCAAVPSLWEGIVGRYFSRRRFLPILSDCFFLFEEEADYWDEYYTKNPPKVVQKGLKPGQFENNLRQGLKFVGWSLKTTGQNLKTTR